MSNAVTLDKDLIAQTVINLFKTNVFLAEVDLPTYSSSALKEDSCVISPLVQIYTIVMSNHTCILWFMQYQRKGDWNVFHGLPQRWRNVNQIPPGPPVTHPFAFLLPQELPIVATHERYHFKLPSLFWRSSPQPRVSAPSVPLTRLVLVSSLFAVWVGFSRTWSVLTPLLKTSVLHKFPRGNKKN